jgi:EmrB/QacA subfamily drug resistance transporter
VQTQLPIDLPHTLPHTGATPVPQSQRPQQERAAGGESDGRGREWVLAACLAGIFSSTFTITILGVSLKPIADDLSSDVATIAWVMTGPMLAQALSLPVLGKLGDLRGHRRVYLIGFSIAAVAAALTACAWDALSLVGFRCLGQLAGTATMPASTALLFNAYPAEERVKAMGWVSLVSAGAPVLGLAVGGLLVDGLGWRPIFIIQACLSLVAIVFAAFVLEESPRGQEPRFDAPGAASLALSAFAFTFAINRWPVWGFTHPAVLTSFAMVPLALWTFVQIERRSAYPLLPLSFFKERNFVAPLIICFAMNFAYMGGFIITPLLLMEVFGYSTALTSMIILCRPVAFAIASPISGHVATRFGERPTAVAGTLCIVIAMLAFCVGAATAGGDVRYSIAALAAGLIVAGWGFGFVQPSIQAVVGNAVSPTHFGIASSALSMAGSVGAVAGISFLTALCADATEPEPFLSGYMLGAAATVVALAAAFRLRGRTQVSAVGPEALPMQRPDRAP